MNGLDWQKFNRLLDAEKVFQSSIHTHHLDFCYQRRVPKVIKRQLTSGTTSTTVQTGRVQLNEPDFVFFVNNGNGSIVLRELASNKVLHPTHRMFHIGVLVNLAFFSQYQYQHEEYHDYLMALRKAALSLFLTKILTPEDLEVFIVISQAMNTSVLWEESFGRTVASWYASKSAEDLRAMVFLWPLNGRWRHQEILKKCEEHLKKMRVQQDVMSVIERLVADDFDIREFAITGNVFSYFDVEGIIPKLRNQQIATSLTRTDIDKIFHHIHKDSFSEKASVLETLLVRKKFEANQAQNLIVGECLREAYRNARKTETYSGPRVGVIPFVSESESRNVDGILLQHKDLSAALLEDLMRNDQSKIFVYTNGVRPNFYHRRQMPESIKMLDLQRILNYNPIKIIKTAEHRQEVFDSFVIVCINGQRIQFDKILASLNAYRGTVNYLTKLVIVGVDDLKMRNPCDISENVLFVSGVHEGTPALLWDFMPPEFEFMF